jgi:hypothetical protein
MSKILLATKSYPPVIGGSAFLLYELLRNFPKDSIEAVYGVNDPPNNSNLVLPFKSKQVLLLNNKMLTVRVNRYFPQLIIWLIKREIKRKVLKENISKIYIHYPNASFSIAAYLVSQELRVPYDIYFDILWEERPGKSEQRLARLYEKKIVESAGFVFAITEFGSDYLSKKHNREVLFVPHTLDYSNIADKPVIHEQGAQLKIHFAGGIYHDMNQDCIVRLLQAVKLTGLDIELEFCTPDIPKEIANENITKKYLSKDELLKAQKKATLLFLPQAFYSSTPDMITNNYPTKTMEYLCSGRPILVHSPSTSYLSYSARKDDYAYVVDEPSVELLAQAILEICINTDLQYSLALGALNFAHTRESRYWADFIYKKLNQ